jgi:arabinose-5-phosphate isomerase
MALGDALAMVLLDAQGFQKSDYARFHPAGAIGRAITLRVTDIMRSGECFATVSPETPVSEAILAMTRTRSGAVAVVDPGKRLLGIFTDGDFRRHIVSDSRVMERAIGEVMTTGAVTIPDTAMAVEVMRILEVRKIDDILVVDHQGRAVGLVDTQDLPRFKLM